MKSIEGQNGPKSLTWRPAPHICNVLFLDFITTESFAWKVDCKQNNSNYYKKRNWTKEVNVGLYGSPEHHWQRLINKYNGCF